MILPFRLNVHQFAIAIQRCDEVVRREIRARNLAAEGRPYLIHPRELKKYQVDPELALERLRLAGLVAPETPATPSIPAPLPQLLSA